MSTSIMLGQLVGPVMVILGISLLLNFDFFKKMIGSLKKEPALLFIMGFFTLILGWSMVLNHNIWVWSWEVVITIVWWGALIKWVLYTVFPASMMTTLSKMKLCPKFMMIVSLVYTAVWGCVSYHAFFA